ncbi:MAG: ABC transporter permease [Patescibacteria group bacterium]|jgi:putative ABC transport system permease protein
MKISDLLTLSTRMFTTRPMRTFLTILGVSIGIGAVLFLVSLGYGMQRVILSQITTADALLSLDVSPGSSGLIGLTQQNIDKLGKISGVSEVARLKSMSGQLGYQELTSDTIFRVIDPAFFRMNGMSALKGELFTAPKEANIVISTATAKLFNVEPQDMINQKISLTINIPSDTIDEESGTPTTTTITFPQPFTIKGIIDDSTASIAYVPLSLVQSLSSVTTFDSIKAKVISQEQAPAIREQIIGQGFIVTSLSDVINQANQIFRILQIVLGMFGLVALVVSAIGMFNTMTIALLERINEIGIMRSIGVTRGDIRKMFIIESMTMGFLGGVGGVLIGILGGVLANIGINLLAKSFGGQSLNLFYNPPWFIAVIIGFSTIVGFLTGLFPSRRAANIDPLEALRYK